MINNLNQPPVLVLVLFIGFLLCCFPMMETDQKVIHNRDEDNESDNKKNAKQLEEDMIKSFPAPTEKSNESVTVIKSYPGEFMKMPFTWMEDVRRIQKPGNPRNVGKPCALCGPSNHTFHRPFLPGGPKALQLNQLSDPDILKYATEAVKEFNKRESKDKIELVKVKWGDVYRVSGFRYDLIFEAKVLADGEGERTQNYCASVWKKNDDTLEVIYVHLAPPGCQGEEPWWEKYRRDE